MEDQTLRPFIALGFNVIKEVGDEVYGTCIFCGKLNKLYINKKTGQFSCKSASCNKEGNVYGFLTEWVNLKKIEFKSEQKNRLQQLSENRGIKIETLKKYVFWAEDRWIIPCRNTKNTIVNLRHYQKLNGKIWGLPGLDVVIFGADKLSDKSRIKDPIYLCEGEWDAMAMEDILGGNPGIPLGIPGAGIFKDWWVDLLNGREVIICFDNDSDGKKGQLKIARKISHVAKIKVIEWSEQFPAKFDIRDLAKTGGTLEVVQSLLTEYNESGITVKPSTELPPLSSGKRIEFNKVLETYKKWLKMNSDLENALKIVYATIISNQLIGDPLWIHIVGPPGIAKSELLMSTGDCSQCVAKSNIGPHTLISGFRLQGNGDPSLIPRLIGKTFILKDLTEILQLQKQHRDEVMSQLRGAYDGKVERQFGNGINRVYEGYFTMISGVTPKLFADQDSTMGERFLIYYMRKPENKIDDIIKAAIENVGDETDMRSELKSIAKQFLDFAIDSSDVPTIPDIYANRIVNLAQFVSLLRATIVKDQFTKRIIYRPESEIGTRIAKQLKKLLLGLSLLKYPAEITEEDYKLISRVALDSCIGFNRDIVITLLHSEKPQSLKELTVNANIPIDTLKEHIDCLVMLGVVEEEKIRPIGSLTSLSKFRLNIKIHEFWKDANLNGYSSQIPNKTVKIKRVKNV